MTMKRENWVVAAGGKEPVMEIEGKKYQYYWETVSGKHAYYCLTDDLFLTDGLEYMLPDCIRPSCMRSPGQTP